MSEFPGESPQSGRLNHRKTIGLSVTFLAAAVIIGLVFYQFGPRTDATGLKKRSEQLTAPPGWSLLGRFSEAGSSSACIVSCPRARVTVVFGAPLAPDQSCRAVRAQVARQVGPITPDPTDPGCGWRTAIPSVGKDAYVRAGAETADVLRTWASLPWPGKVDLNRSATYVWAIFSAGPT
jgi:hypothetical protein